MPKPRFHLSTLGYGKTLHMEYVEETGRLMCIDKNTNNLMIKPLMKDLSLTVARNNATCRFCHKRADRRFPRKQK